jgi:hypothetical protein
MLQKGCLVDASISGYKEFLALAELEHAQSIVHDLLNNLIDGIRNSPIFSKLEENSISL